MSNQRKKNITDYFGLKNNQKTQNNDPMDVDDPVEYQREYNNNNTPLNNPITTSSPFQSLSISTKK